MKSILEGFMQSLDKGSLRYKNNVQGGTHFFSFTTFLTVFGKNQVITIALMSYLHYCSFSPLSIICCKHIHSSLLIDDRRFLRF
jgi:hypothetical protein